MSAQKQEGIEVVPSGEVVSDDAQSSSRFSWFSLDKLSALQARLAEEELEGLDSASVLDGDSRRRIAAQEKLEAGRFVRGDSGESSESIGDLPIELPHLEDEDDMYNFNLPQIHDFTGIRQTARGRSRSLDGVESVHANGVTKSKQQRPMIGDTGRAFTCDDSMVKIGTLLHNSIDHPNETTEEDATMKSRKLLKDFKSTLSASLKSIDISIRSGSITSISSGKSFVSNFSVKSDSGISLPAPKQAHPQPLPSLLEQQPSDGSVHPQPKLGRRPWESEPLLNATGIKRKKDSSNSKTDRSSSRASLNNYGLEKEKSRVMQSVESKLMNAIKEVNESDLSEGNTPMNSPGPAALLQQQNIKNYSKSSGANPRSTEFLFQGRDLAIEAGPEDVKICQATSLSMPSPIDTEQQCESSTLCKPTAVVSNVGAEEKTQPALEEPTTATTPSKVEGSLPTSEKVDENVEEAPGPTFEDLKATVRAMPKFRPFHHTENLGGSMDRGSIKDQPRCFGWGKQMSLHDELLSHERLTANVEIRKKIQKQQSLPDNDVPKRSLKAGLMEVMSKSKQFESLKQSLVMLRNNASTVAEEKEDVFTPKEKDSEVSKHFGANQSSTLQEQELKQEAPNSQSQQSSGQAIRSGIVRIWQSWRSGDKTDGPSFTHKRGVTIQPIDVRGRDALLEGGTAGRRNLFQRRRGGSSPLSPQQLEALSKEDSMSPTSFRRCCMDCPSGDLVFVEQSAYFRERKLSKGGEASDSSSKDGSIQSDTSLDSEDSCVSVIFVPHPDGKFGLTGEPVPELIGKFNTHRKQSTSNSSESSESTQSGRGSPILSPGLRGSLGSPSKTTSSIKLELIRQTGSQFESHTIVARNLNEDGSCNETVYCLTERPLEKIDERHTESESEAEKETAVITVDLMKDDDTTTALTTTSVKDEAQTEDISTQHSCLADQKQEPAQQGNEVALLQHVDDFPNKEPDRTMVLLKQRLSVQKSFEMEDIPDENPIKCHPEGMAQKRRFKSAKTRQRASQQLPNKPKYDYSLVRHHPLFAKQTKPGEGTSNFSSLLMGNNIRILRSKPHAGIEIGPDGHGKAFELFNPEVDDSDSDNDGSVSSHSSSESSSSPDSNDSVESVVSASRIEDNKDEHGSCETSKKNGNDMTEANGSDKSAEISRRAEQRRQSLLSLLDENQSVLTTITEKKRLPMSYSRSNSSLKLESAAAADKDDKSLIAAQRATGAIPKKILPAIVEPVGESKKSTKKRLDKARSVSPSSIGAKEVSTKVVRQSSVPGKLDDMIFACSNEANSSTSSSSNKTSPLARHQDGQQYLSPTPSASDTSGIQVKGSHESLTESTDSASFLSDKKSKSSSPSRSDASSSDNKRTSHQPSLSSTLPKKLTHSMKKMASIEDPITSGGSSKQESFDLPTLDEENPDVGGFPIHHRRLIKRGRDDSIESNAPSAKSSIQYSDTSSLLSHRFSTISISSNVSSSDVSISAGGHSGSSCYLASMSSTDFDERPILASSFSLSEAEAEADTSDIPPKKPQLQPKQQRVKLKTAYRRNPFVQKQENLLPATEEEGGGTGRGTERSPRSRILTETSIETSIENPTCIDHGDSFEEELLHAFSRDEDDNDDDDDEIMLENAPIRRNSKTGSSNNSGSVHRASLSAASSNESLHSESGGSQTYHRYYHVFKEGELDYLINTYVDNLHIISSYYDHANWCIVAEKVNVWTI